MNIIGAIIGFALASLILGVIGAVFSGIMWAERADDGENTFLARSSFALCILMIFLGCILIGAFG